MLIARVKGPGDQVGTLNLECAQIAGAHMLRNVPPIQHSGLWGQPEPESEVLVSRYGSELRWTPHGLNSPPAWAGAKLRGLSDPTGDVVMLLDGNGRVVRLGTASAAKKVVHEDVFTSVLDPLRTALNAVKAYAGSMTPTGGTPAALAVVEAAITALDAAMDIRTNYESPAVLVPALAIAKGGGGA